MDAEEDGGSRRLLYVSRDGDAQSCCYVCMYVHAVGHRRFAKTAGRLAVSRILGPDKWDMNEGGGRWRTVEDGGGPRSVVFTFSDASGSPDAFGVASKCCAALLELHKPHTCLCLLQSVVRSPWSVVRDP